MDVQYLNPFVMASYTVMEMLLDSVPMRGEVAVQDSTFTCDTCNVICGVTGQVQGQVIYGMSIEVANQIASKMLGYQLESFDELGASAVAELGNMISGSAVQYLADAGLICDITPPTLLTGGDIHFGMTAIPAMVVPLTTPQGLLNLTVGLKSRN